MLRLIVSKEMERKKKKKKFICFIAICHMDMEQISKAYQQQQQLLHDIYISSINNDAQQIKENDQIICYVVL